MTTDEDVTHFNCGFFSLRLSASSHALTSVVFVPHDASLPEAQRRFSVPLNPILSEACAQFASWLQQPDFCFKLPLAISGTPFRQAVWKQIASIPRGGTRTYGEIARELRSSPRAVGQACGDNDFPIIVPCHRVLSVTGLGGFNHSTGNDLLSIKRWLLAREGISGGQQ